MRRRSDPAPPIVRGPRLDRRRRPADRVQVGDAGQVDPAGARQPVPLPEPRVDLHQLEPPIALVEPELGLRDAVVAERLEQRERLLDGVVAPARLADPAGAEAPRHLRQLAPAEHAERPPLCARVGADGPERVVGARDHLLHERSRIAGLAPSRHELIEVRADEHRPAVAPLERDRVARLDQCWKGQLGGGLANLLLARRRERARRRDPDGLRDRVLVALPLQLLEHAPARARQAVARQPRRVPRDHRERHVVGGKADRRLAQVAGGEIVEEGDVRVLVGRVGSEHGMRPP